MTRRKNAYLLAILLPLGCSSADSDGGVKSSDTADAGLADSGSARDSQIADADIVDGSTDVGVDVGVDVGAGMDGGPDAGEADAQPRCRSGVGLSAPVSVCSITEPCTELLPTYARLDPPVERIDIASDLPYCGTSTFGVTNNHPLYAEGPPRSWTDDHGTSRYWCETRPANTGTTTRPLLIFVPGSGGYAGSVFDTTLLRQKQPSYDLSDDPNRPGFVLVSIQPRNLHWPTVDPQEGTKSDSQYRDLASPSTNPDIAFFDNLIDTLVAEGAVDPLRIYLMGWSNGARFAVFYGIARHENATPGNNHVAAVANYSGGDPFAPPTFNDPDCQAAPYPTSALPYFLISRTCDAIACNEAQSLGVVPGNVVEPWITVLEQEVGADVTWQRIDDDGRLRYACAITGLCGSLRQLRNHSRWPDGIWDGGGRDHEPLMLDFLRDHPL